MNRCLDTDIDLKYGVSSEVFYFFAIYNFSVWTVLTGLQGKNLLFVCTSLVMLALDNLIFREREFVWMDCQLLLRESWKVLRERRLLI